MALLIYDKFPKGFTSLYETFTKVSQPIPTFFFYKYCHAYA